MLSFVIQMLMLYPNCRHLRLKTAEASIATAQLRSVSKQFPAILFEKGRLTAVALQVSTLRGLG